MTPVPDLTYVLVVEKHSIHRRVEVIITAQNRLNLKCDDQRAHTAMERKLGDHCKKWYL